MCRDAHEVGRPLNNLSGMVGGNCKHPSVVEHTHSCSREGPPQWADSTACLIAGEEVLQTVHGIMGDSESRQIREEGHLPAGLLQDLLTEVCKEPQDAPCAHHFSRVCWSV
ncbi:hypothetical protein MHYP_G00069660 [Metynnis hypsauchen]